MFRLGKVFAIGFLLWSISAGCDSSPTVPVPPPQATLIKTTTPDVNGFVTVTGAPDPRFGIQDVALVFNDDTGVGAMTDVEDNGGFETRIQAQINHLLVIQILRGGRVSQGTEIPVQ